MSEEIPKEPQVIFCEMCTEEDRKPARKTCMKCEISMCVQHLQAHLTTPVLLQTHPLTEPMVLCGTTKCPQHGKLLEYYCLDDMTCLCVSCAIEDQHRLHNMKTFTTAHKELMEKLNGEQKALHVKIDDVNVSLEKWEKSQREKVARSSVRLIEAVSSLRDVTLTSVQSSVTARMASIRTGKRSMEVAQAEKDTFRFLQMHSQVHQDVEKAKAVDLRKGLEPGSDREKLVQEIRENGKKMVEQADHFWGSLLTLVDPENHQELVTTSPDLILDPQVLSPGISLSKDKREVFYNSWMGKCSATLLLRSTKSVANFQRWVVHFPNDCEWTTGLCDKQSAKTMDGAIYGLCYKDDQLNSLTAEYDDCCDASKNPQGFGSQESDKQRKAHKVSSASLSYLDENGDEAIPEVEIVEVLWNFAASSLAFFGRTGQYQRQEIITLKMSLNNWDLTPFIQLKMTNDQNTDQQNWVCSCGKNYYKYDKGYRNQYNELSHQGNCSCGAIIGGVFTTERICELV